MSYVRREVIGNAVLYLGDALTVLRDLPAESVHCCVTSPPYWGLRQYLFDGAVTVRRDLDAETRKLVEKELADLGIKPRA